MSEIEPQPWSSSDLAPLAELDNPRRRDRRRIERRSVELSGYLIRPTKEVVDVKVVDLSYDGCSVQTLVPLTAGEKIKLSILGRGGINGCVRWYKNRRAGLSFKPERASRTRWPRKARRIEVSGEASLRRRGRISYRVRLFDISQIGCKCEFVERPTIYEPVWIKFDGLESLEATVCWLEDSAVGLFYRNPIHGAVFSMLLDRLGRAADTTNW